MKFYLNILLLATLISCVEPEATNEKLSSNKASEDKSVSQNRDSGENDSTVQLINESMDIVIVEDKRMSHKNKNIIDSW